MSFYWNRVLIAGTFLLSLSLSMISICATAAVTPANICQIQGYDKDGLMALREAEYKIDEAENLDGLALEMLSCLADPDPDLRDKFAYEGYVALLRNDRLTDKTLETLRTELIKILAPETSDQAGFKKPFAALVLAELARSDRVDPNFTSEQRQEIIDSATVYMTNIRDYRGYDETNGWRHGVAHTSDLLMQLSLNKALSPAQHKQIREAVRSQIIPGDAHFYIYGEPDRLARPILYLALQGAFNTQDWTGWMADLADPAPFESWNDVYQSQKGLAKLHNAKAFANAIYLNAANSENANVQALATPALDVLKALP